MPVDNLKPIPYDAPRAGSRWRHWKGQCVAQVLGVLHHTESGELLVSYLEERSGLKFARPLSMWTDRVASGEQRFTPVDEVLT